MHLEVRSKSSLIVVYSHYKNSTNLGKKFNRGHCLSHNYFTDLASTLFFPGFGTDTRLRISPENIFSNLCLIVSPQKYFFIDLRYSLSSSYLDKNCRRKSCFVLLNFLASLRSDTTYTKHLLTILIFNYLS